MPRKTVIAASGQFGPFLRNFRMTKKLSQTELGKKVGLSQERISRIEAEPEKVNLDQLITVLMALDARLSVEAFTPLSGHASSSATATGELTTATSKDSW